MRGKRLLSAWNGETKIQRGKNLPSEFVPESELWLHNGFPSAGHRLLTLTTICWVPVSGAPLESVSAVSCQHPPHAGPAPAPGPTPNKF